MQAYTEQVALLPSLKMADTLNTSPNQRARSRTTSEASP